MCYLAFLVDGSQRQKAKLSIYWSILVPTLPYSHEVGVMTESARWHIIVAEMGCLGRVVGISLRDKVSQLGGSKK